jgi:tetratricopeptide (TPR) repeat protein
MANRETLTPRVAAATGADAIYTLAREAFDAPADLGYAKEILSGAGFTGDAGSKACLDDTAGNAMFTNDFVCLAMGYKALGDAAKADEMLGQGQDYAMSGEEKVAVGVGQMLVSGDAAAASKTLTGALKEISTTEELYGLAKVVACDIKDSTLAGQIYDKIKTKAGRAADFGRLARTIAADLGDKAQAAQIINEGAAKFSTPADLIALSGAMGEIDPSAAGALYDKALESAKDFTALMQVLDAAKGNAEFTKAVLTKAGATATASSDLIKLADVYAEIGDTAGVNDMVTKAEEGVANLDEMRKVVEAVNKHMASDTARVARLAEMLAKREANQSKYIEIQNEEAKAKTAKQFIALSDRVIAELDDKSYSSKLLSTAEDVLRADGFHFSRFKPLILGVDRLGDKEWLGKLLDESVAASNDFVWFREIVLTAAREFKDTEFGKAKAKAYLEGRAAQSGDNPYDWTKLAETAQVALGDSAWASNLLAEAAKRAKDHFALAQIGKLFADLGDASTAKAMYAKAVDACTTGEGCVQLASRLNANEMAKPEIGELMSGCAGKLASASDKLRWAEGVSDLLLDSGWTVKAYAAIANSFNDETGKKRLARSQQMREGYRFFGPGVQAH